VLLPLGALLLSSEPARAQAPALSLKASGVELGGRTHVLRGQAVVLRGRVRHAPAGARVVLSAVRAGRRPATLTPRVRPSGRLRARFRVRRTGSYVVSAALVAPGAAPVALGRPVVVRSVAPRLRAGRPGLGVRLLQRGLRALGYAAPKPRGGARLDAATARAVLAYRKVNGLARTGRAGPEVLERVFRGRGAFPVRHPKAGRHVEFDWSRQVLVLARGARVERAYHASSGKAATPTVLGSYRFYDKRPGTNASGMLHSSYFLRGYAVHGYPSVPNFPASHGCIRVPIADARAIYDRIALGERIFVYP
jgi:hypothetical protein